FSTFRLDPRYLWALRLDARYLWVLQLDLRYKIFVFFSWIQDARSLGSSAEFKVQ
ncbi:16524_t:CDS:2, partial [Funneliformis geosporum]